jgi:hypothetical protein
VRVGAAVRVGVEVAVAVLVGVAVGVPGGCKGVGVAVGVSVGVDGVAVAVGVSVGCNGGWSPLSACAAREEIYVAGDAVAACGRTAWLTTTTLSASRRGALTNPRARPGKRRTLKKRLSADPIPSPLPVSSPVLFMDAVCPGRSGAPSRDQVEFSGRTETHLRLVTPVNRTG